MLSLLSGGFFSVNTLPTVQKEMNDRVDSVAIIAFKAIVTLTRGRVVPIIELSTCLIAQSFLYFELIVLLLLLLSLPSLVRSLFAVIFSYFS
jgi:ubiquinone biosynthesis protein Coq4